MANRREEMENAMGPDEEPGEAHPPRAEESTGLGGPPGTEGSPGPPEGGTEPAIPADIGQPALNDAELREAAERILRELSEKEA